MLSIIFSGHLILPRSTENSRLFDVLSMLIMITPRLVSSYGNNDISVIILFIVLIGLNSSQQYGFLIFIFTECILC